jgi:hypothetical protein
MQRLVTAPFGLIVLSRGASFTISLFPISAMTPFPSLQLGDKLVSYYPVKTIYGDILKEWCFCFISSQKDNSFSKQFLNRVEKTLDIREYINAGYSFASDNSNLPQLGNPFNGAV